MRKRIYQWHRTLSLIIALPVLLWAGSGIMHPLMTNIRPRVAAQSIPPQPIDTSLINITLEEALRINHIDRFQSVRIVYIGAQQFYQLKVPGFPRLEYLSTQNGRRLQKGDELYARWLARQFLEGRKKDAMHPVMNMVIPAVHMSAEDCCSNATAAVLDDNGGASIKYVEFQEQFGKEYKYINRLLPVYKVGFDRADSIRVYVETGQDRFAFAMDKNRAVFDQLFSLFHTLGWLDMLGSFKHVIEGAIMLMAFCTTLMGLYIFFTTRSKTPNGNPVMRARRNHRRTSLVASLFTLLFTFSGGYHAFSKIAPEDIGRYAAQNSFRSTDTRPDMPQLLKATEGRPLNNIGLVKYRDTIYWQLYTRDTAGQRIRYVRAADYQTLPNGDETYARYLASVFSGHNDNAKSAAFVTRFAGEYGFVNKRLPVWRIDYGGNERYYIETSTGRLAARMDNGSLAEGYSFALLHKHEFMAWAGKPVKDASTIFWAATQIAMVLVGLLLYIRMKQRRAGTDSKK
ncbi:MAG: PepSY domain-containing protein [Bacteroidetes bacterium]|nr:PepSY domain-containing protein [Bacteroidota bacterium]